MTQILVVRREDEFSRTLIAKGFSVINCPVVGTLPLEDLSGLENVLSRLDKFNGIFITSSTAAEIFGLRAGDRLNKYRGHVFVLGRQSFDILKDTAADVAFNEATSTAGDMLDLIGVEQLQGRRFLYIRGERSMRTIPERLKGIADIEEVIVYQTIKIAVSHDQKKEIREKTSRGSIAMTCFFSPSGVESFVEQVGAGTLILTRLAAIGETTANVLRAFQLNVDVVAKSPVGEGFAADVLEYLKPVTKRSSI